MFSFIKISKRLRVACKILGSNTQGPPLTPPTQQRTNEVSRAVPSILEEERQSHAGSTVAILKSLTYIGAEEVFHPLYSKLLDRYTVLRRHA